MTAVTSVDTLALKYRYFSQHLTDGYHRVSCQYCLQGTSLLQEDLAIEYSSNQVMLTVNHTQLSTAVGPWTSPD